MAKKGFQDVFRKVKEYTENKELKVNNDIFYELFRIEGLLK